MASQKTSFKALLKVQASPAAGGGVGKIKEHRDRLTDVRQQYKPSAARAAPPGAVAGKRDASALDGPPAEPSKKRAPQGDALDGFVPTQAFAGPRAGYVFKHGERGVGYYRDGTSPAVPGTTAAAVAAAVPPPAAPPSAPVAAAAPPTQPGSALPSDFFDNPQEDPSNRGRSDAQQLSTTQKGERLRQELASFAKAIEPEVARAHATDELEEEAEAELRAVEEAHEQRAFSQRFDAIRARASTVSRSERQPMTSVGALSHAALAAAADGAESDEEGEEGLEQEMTLDWRSKGV